MWSDLLVLDADFSRMYEVQNEMERKERELLAAAGNVEIEGDVESKQ